MQEKTTPSADTDTLEELSDFYKSEEKCGLTLSDKLAGIVMCHSLSTSMTTFWRNILGPKIALT